RNRSRRPYESRRYIGAWILPQFDSGLLFDAPKRAERQVFLRMRNRDAARYRVVLELNVTALLGDLPPTIRNSTAENPFCFSRCDAFSRRSFLRGAIRRSPSAASALSAFQSISAEGA